MIAPIYVAAREVLLDALEALGEQRHRKYSGVRTTMPQRPAAMKTKRANFMCGILNRTGPAGHPAIG